MTQLGRIDAIPLGKQYAFIVAKDGERYFFHSSQFHGDFSRLRKGDDVRFEPNLIDGRKQARNVSVGTSTIRRPLPRYDGPRLNLDDEQRQKSLLEISRWKLEAKLDDVARYFYSVPELNSILTGDSSYIIGRKGTGKTALVQYLSQIEALSGSVEKLTFKNFPFNELYTQVNSSYTRPNQYITIWKLIIYSATCRLISNNRRTDALVKQKIDKAFPPADSDSLGTIVGKWISGNFGFSILGSGIQGGGWFKDKTKHNLQEKVENLQAFVFKNAPDVDYYILFDELDEDYKDTFEKYDRNEYLDLLTSLFKAVQDVKSDASRFKVRIRPVIFLRDDIYDLLKDADKNKWRDFQVILDWREESIRDLVSYRIGKAIDSASESRSTVHEFNSLWYSIFTSKQIPYSSGKKTIASFDYVKMSTHGRPRDYINYLQEAATIELRRSRTEISIETIKDADKSYSNYLKKELIDEIHGLVPDIDTVLSIFSETRKSILSIDEFRVAYAERYASGRLKIKDADFVLRTLFYFSVIGNVLRVGVHIFRHSRPDAELNFREKIVVHRGLVKSLQII